MTEDYFKGLEVQLVDVDATLKEEIRAVVKHQFSTNAYKEQTREQLKTQQKEAKPFDKGFDFMESLHFNKFTQPAVSQQDQLKLNIHDIKSLSHSKDYLASLHPTQPNPPLTNEQKELAEAIELSAEYTPMDEQYLKNQDRSLSGEDGKDDVTPELEEPDID